MSVGWYGQELKWTRDICPWGEVCVMWNVHRLKGTGFDCPEVELLWGDLSMGWKVKELKVQGFNCTGVERSWGDMYRGWASRGEMCAGWQAGGWSVPWLLVNGVEWAGVNCLRVICLRGEMSMGWIVPGLIVLGCNVRMLDIHRWNGPALIFQWVNCNGVKKHGVLSVRWIVHRVNCTGIECP